MMLYVFDYDLHRNVT